MDRSRPGLASLALALLALMMLSLASVQAIVMQTSLSAPGEMAPDCRGREDPGMAGPGAMPGMVMDGAHAQTVPHRQFRIGQDHKAACPYCKVAGHLPVIGWAPLPQRIGIAVFAAFHVVASHGPRGPPVLERRARGPPTSILTA